MREKLTYLASSTLDDLYQSIPANIERYRSGDFLDLVDDGDWSIRLSLEVDLDQLSKLDPSGGPDVEVENSLLVWKALDKMTPALACEDRVWTRLSHVECLEYSRKRWITAVNEERVLGNIRKHFFAPGLTACRDDHAISRLWWNARIAKDISPANQRGALGVLLKSADIRKSLVERSWTLSRNSVGAAIIRHMLNDSWITDKEVNFREFMKAVNHRGGGIAFELQTDDAIDDFMAGCVSAARSSAPTMGSVIS